MPNRFFPRDPGYYHHSWGHGIFSLIFFFAIVALLVLLAVWLVNGLRQGHYASHGALPPHQPREDIALGEARMRYARGELTRKQFLEITEDLGGAPPPSPPTPAPPS